MRQNVVPRAYFGIENFMITKLRISTGVSNNLLADRYTCTYTFFYSYE